MSELQSRCKLNPDLLAVLYIVCLRNIRSYFLRSLLASDWIGGTKNWYRYSSHHASQTTCQDSVSDNLGRYGIDTDPAISQPLPEGALGDSQAMNATGAHGTAPTLHYPTMLACYFQYAVCKTVLLVKYWKTSTLFSVCPASANGLAMS